jgi:hypothetical protein
VSDPDSTSELRVEYRALAERNWGAIQAIHRSYERLGRRTQWLLALLFVVQVATGVALGLVYAQVADNQRAGLKALCTFRDDLQSRADQSKAFLITHPAGVAGISASVIRQGIVNQERTIRSLHELPCPPRVP